ncbi:hypothetical protein MRX96_031535 [Rhipicephalus microplus]
MSPSTPATLLFIVHLLPFFHQASGSSSAGHSSQRHSLGCFQCSWLAEQVVDAERQKDLTKRWKEAYERSEDAIDNPFKEPLLGVDTFSEMPTKSQLFAHCSNCTKPDGMCARWTFYGNTGQPVNVTWMCVNSLETGCFVEYMASHFVKEVCLCADRHHCNAAGSATSSVSLVAVLLWTAWMILS